MKCKAITGKGERCQNGGNFLGFCVKHYVQKFGGEE